MPRRPIRGRRKPVFKKKEKILTIKIDHIIQEDREEFFELVNIGIIKKSRRKNHYSVPESLLSFYDYDEQDNHIYQLYEIEIDFFRKENICMFSFGRRVLTEKLLKNLDKTLYKKAEQNLNRGDYLQLKNNSAARILTGISFNDELKNKITKDKEIISDEKLNCDICIYNSNTYIIFSKDRNNLRTLSYMNRILHLVSHKTLSFEDGIKVFINTIKDKTFNKANDIEQEITAQREKLAKLNNDYGKIQFMINIVNTSGGELIKNYIEKISEIPEVEKVEFSQYGIILETKAIWCDYTNLAGEFVSRHYMGRYKIYYNLKAGNLRIKNIAKYYKKEKNNMHHPHQFCTGGYYGVLQSCMLSMDIYTMFLTTIEYLKSVNPKDHSINRLIDSGFITHEPEKTYEISTYYNLVTSREDESDNIEDEDEDEDEDDFDD